MYKHYYINDNQTSNPGLHHEVHTKEHAAQLGIRSKQYVGYYANEVEAVALNNVSGHSAPSATISLNKKPYMLAENSAAIMVHCF